MKTSEVTRRQFSDRGQSWFSKRYARWANNHKGWSKMKKLNRKGFVLAETLVVTVFLMIIFTMIYQNFVPLMGEYERRENYDN